MITQWKIKVILWCLNLNMMNKGESIMYDKDKYITTYVCMYSTPSDNWEILRVTENPMKAL